MSDILLSFGVQKGAADVERIRGDLDSILASLDRNPPQVRVGLTIDESAIAHFRAQLSSVVSAISLTNGAPITINISGLGEITAEAGRAQEALGGVADAARDASQATQEATDNTRQSANEAARAAQEAARAEQQRQALLKQSTNLITRMQDAERNWTAAATGRSSESYENIRAYRAELEVLQQRFLSGQITTDEFRARLTALGTNFTTAASQIRSAGEQTRTFSERLSGLAAKFSTWLSVSQVIMLAVRAIKQMVSTVIELDTAMTELKKVTDESDATYARFLDGATERAKKLGASISDTVTATADFARLGYGIDDASALADVAIIYKNIGDGIEDISTASESIISTMQAFGIASSDAMSIVDRFNEVGNNFAISSAGIGEAMQRSAAAMAAANNTIDETIALITAANTIVQNPESVGTTLKTVSMYLRAAKTEAEEAGESTAGMADSVSELRQEILDLTGQKVDIQIDEDTFKSTYQILKELSEVWDSLTDVSQANLLELIGGKRNANVVSALLENFKVAEDALKSSMESAGSAVAENEKHLDSIKGKLAEFTAQFQSLSATFINSEFVKGVVEFGTFLLKILEVVGNLVNALGGLSNVLFTIAGIILTIKIDSIIGRLSSIANSIKNLTFLTGTFGTTFKQCFDMARLDGASGFRATLTGLAAGFDAVTTSASAAQIAVGAFVALFSIATMVSNAITQAEQATKSANEQLINAKIAAVEESESLYDLYAAYETAKAGLTENEESKKALQTAAENLAVALGYEKDAVDGLNDSYDELTKNELQTAVSDAKIAVDTAEKNLVGLMDTFRDSTEKQLISMWGYAYLGVDVMSGSQEERAKNLIATYDLLVAEQRRLVEAGETESIGYKNIASSIEYLRPQVEALTSANGVLADATQRYNDIINGTVISNDAASESIKSIEDMKKKVSEALTQWSSETEAQLAGLNDIQTGFVFDLVINQGVTKWDDVLAQLADFDEAAWLAQQSWKAYTDQLATILESGDVSAISNEITTLADALSSLSDGTLGADDVVALIEQFPELAEYVDFTADNFGNLEEGLRALIKSSPEEFIKTLQEFKETNNLTGKAADQIDALCDAVSGLSTDAIRDINGEFGVLAESIRAATEAQNELEAALAEDDWDTGYEGRVEAYGGFQEVLDAGEYGSKAYAAYKEYFGLIEKSPEQIKAWMESNKKYFTEGTDGVLAFLQTVESLSGTGGALEGIASFDAETGEFWYDINELGAFADALGWTEEMLQDFIYKYRMYCEEWESRSPADTMKELTNAGLISQIGNVDFGPTFASLKELQEYTGLGEQGVYDLIDSINELRAQEGLPNISLIGRDITEVTQTSITQWQNLGATAEEVSALLIDLAQQDVAIAPNLYIDTESGPQIDVDTLLAEAGIDGSETVHIEVDMTVNNEPAMATIEATVAEVEAILGEGWEALLSADTADAETRIQAVQTLLEELPPSTDVLVLDSTGLARSNLSKVIDLLGTIDANKTKTITIRYQTIGMPMFAEGTSGAKAGPALLGDEYSPTGSPKPELVVSGDKAYLAGQSGPEIGYLNDGDIVYTADETKRILRGNILHKSIPAHAGGAGNGLIDTGGLSGGDYNFSGKKPSGNSSNKNSNDDDEESWFERQYKDHQHWLAMDQESVDDYLKWLDEAYQKAYEEGIIDLDEYYKYQEEVYQGVQEQFKDHINDIDHEISLLEAGVGNSDEIINLSLQAMADIEAELAAARAAGLDENSDYIQWLEQQWMNYSENVTGLREQAETEAQSSIDNLVEYRVKMLKQEIQDQKDALNEQLDELQDFYDKQRKMLQDQYDEEKYLEEQKEKRKSVTDIRSELAMLENDDSAWAQKRKLELQAELSDAEKELNSFEKDHALDMTLDMLDEQQAAQEAQIQAQMDALDEKLNDPHALFNQALEDIKNNTAELYQQFIEYNRKHGTGNDQDIADMWEEAYIADLEYQDTHDGAHPDGIEIGNYTGYVRPENPTPPEPPEEQNPPEEKPPEEPKEPEPPKLTDAIKKKVAAAIWNGGYGWGNGSTRTNRLTEVFGAGNGIQDLVNKGVGKTGVSLTNEYTYANMRKKFKGYASGTDNATPGWHKLFEGDLDEYVFTSSDGNRYRMFSGLGDKVLNGEATDFLYDFANSGGTILTKMLADLFGHANLGNIAKPVQAIEIHSGDIIVQGNANERSVSEIRRAQRENLKFVITEFNKLNK